jgi:ribonuclease J
MFLVEADGKRILHTGDFRQHGYLGKDLIPTIEKYILKNENIDYLIIEGTMLSRPNEKVKTEQEIQQEATRLMKQYKYVFVLCSSTDIDRLASFYQASQSNGRSFLVDDYQKEVLDIFTSTAGKKSSCFQFNNIYFYNQKTAAQFALIENKGFCMPIRSKHLPHLEKLLQLPKEQTLLIYSMWSGYLANGKNPNQDYVDIWDSFTNKEKLHTSGHASCETLEEVCNLIKPTTAIIPIHSEQSQAFKDLKIAEDLKSKIVISALGREDIDIRIGTDTTGVVTGGLA